MNGDYHDFDETCLTDLHLYDGMEEFPCIGQELMLKGPAGRLEAITEYPPDYRGKTPIAIICHPHPLYGGSMANKVVHIISETFVDLGIPTLRFNFRGVGHSQGRYGKGEAEQEDLVAVSQWFRKRHPDSPLWVAGFSFGAYVAYDAYPELEPDRLLLVSPPLGMFDFAEDRKVDVPWMVIQGGKDDIISPDMVSRWVSEREPRPEYYFLNEADHFFHGRLNRIRHFIETAWKDDVRPAVAADIQ